jgi:hypothetical protein
VNNHLEGHHILIQGTITEPSGESEAYGGKLQILQSGLTFDLCHPRCEAGVQPTKPCHSIDVTPFVCRGKVPLYVNTALRWYT